MTDLDQIHEELKGHKLDDSLHFQQLETKLDKVSDKLDEHAEVSAKHQQETRESIIEMRNDIKWGMKISYFVLATIVTLVAAILGSGNVHF